MIAAERGFGCDASVDATLLASLREATLDLSGLDFTAASQLR